MAFIMCCNQNRSCDVYRLSDRAGFLLNYAYYIEACPVCGHTILLLKRYLPDGTVSEVRKTNVFARKLFEKIRPEILFKIPKNYEAQGGKTFLKYNEFGVVKKCYSNLSTLQIGKFDYLGPDLPKIPEKIPINFLSKIIMGST